MPCYYWITAKMDNFVKQKLRKAYLGFLCKKSDMLVTQLDQSDRHS